MRQFVTKEDDESEGLHAFQPIPIKHTVSDKTLDISQQKA